MTRRATVLISGAGIAGPTLAYWLERAGMTPVLVEAAPALRTGGYMIDFWGLGFSVAEAMGLGDRLREIGCRIQELRLMGETGDVIGRLHLDAVMRALGDRYVSLLRGDLARELYRAIEDRVETIFADSVVWMQQDVYGVDVEFASGAARRVDLVIGADGLHSRVRELAFGADESFEIPLGYSFAAFTASDYPHVDPLTYVSRTAPGRQVVRCALPDGRTVFFMVVASELMIQQRSLARIFAEIGSEAQEILQALDRADDLYIDAVSQVHMPAWSRGRVALVGDAAFCPSLLAGEGSSFAMTGAYILAGELAAADGHFARAFLAYERRFKPFIDHKQRSARRLGPWFAPRTHAGLFVRNQITRLAAIPGLSNVIVGPMVANDLPLPDYRWETVLT